MTKIYGEDNLNLDNMVRLDIDIEKCAELEDKLRHLFYGAGIIANSPITYLVLLSLVFEYMWKGTAQANPLYTKEQVEAAARLTLKTFSEASIDAVTGKLSFIEEKPKES